MLFRSDDQVIRGDLHLVKVRERGNIGIPCFVREDGSVAISLKHYDAGRFTEAAPTPALHEGASCSLDGTGC